MKYPVTFIIDTLFGFNLFFPPQLNVYFPNIAAVEFGKDTACKQQISILVK